MIFQPVIEHGPLVDTFPGSVLVTSGAVTLFTSGETIRTGCDAGDCRVLDAD
jgi:hypothetical protein